MNIINDIGKQISGLFASMTPSARVMAGLMLGVIVVSLGWIISSQSSAQHEYLFGGRNYTDAELELWEATFGEAGLREYERVGKRIRVPVGEKDLYLKALSSASALPKEWGGYMDAAINSNSPFDPNSLIQLRTETARERELANLIRRMPGIEFAAVEYDEQRTGFARNTERVCSISVQSHTNAPIAQPLLEVIAKQAETYFAGLPRDKITVTDLGAGFTHRGSNNPDAMEDNPYLKAQQAFENSYHEKLASILHNTFNGEFQLSVSVKLDPTLRSESEQLKYDPTAVTLQSSESRRDLDTAKAPPGGVPGAASNGISNQPQTIAGNAAQTSKTKESEANERRVAGHEATITKKAPMVPESVTIAVGIPDSYYEKIWAVRFLRENPDKKEDIPPRPSPTELTALKSEAESMVRSAVEGIPVGLRQGDESKTLVKVYSYTDLPVPELPEITLAQSTLAWFSESWSTLGLMVIVLVALGMMFSWVKSQNGVSEAESKFSEGFGLKVPESLADELDLADGEDIVGEDGVITPGKRAKPSFDLSGEEIKEDLSTLIKENPDAAVNLLKTWIGDAA
ncbi:MAG: flagellar M-ring protein FliF C-terminal domain-containing protein [Pirellulaceae bacterium]